MIIAHLILILWSYIWNISSIELRMWDQVGYDPRGYEHNLCNCVHGCLKNSGLQRGLNLWPRDTGATKATDVESWSFVGSNEVLNFSGFNIRNCINCVHNCEDHSFLDLYIAYLVICLVVKRRNDCDAIVELRMKMLLN